MGFCFWRKLMPWAIWSPEEFPKRGDQGYMVDYVQAYRIQVALHENQWTELEADGFYKDTYVTSWVDKEADQKEITISAKELAIRIVRDKGAEFNGVFVPVGLMYCNTDKTTPEEMKALEEEGKRRNLIFKRKTVEQFEMQFRVKMQGGPGRWSPNTYEQECYKAIGQTPPEVVNRPTVQAPANIQIIQPDPAQLAALVAAEVAKIEAARKPIREI
jgi:hypothetical protein